MRVRGPEPANATSARTIGRSSISADGIVSSSIRAGVLKRCRHRGAGNAALTMRATSAGHPVVSGRRMELSVVIPVYGCSGTLRPLHEQLSKVLPVLSDRYEIVFVDDRAGDGSWPILQELAQADQHVIACRLSRNFGQQIAITAGLEQSRGDYVVVMDCDLQDPPEVIAELVASARGGFDIVFAKRKASYRSPFRTIAGRVYFFLLGLLSGCWIDDEVGAFSIISRRVVEAFLAFRER